MQKNQLFYKQASVSSCSHLSDKRVKDIRPATTMYQGRRNIILAYFRVCSCQSNISKIKKKKEISVFSVFSTSVLRNCEKNPKLNCAANKKWQHYLCLWKRMVSHFDLHI